MWNLTKSTACVDHCQKDSLNNLVEKFNQNFRLKITTDISISKFYIGHADKSFINGKYLINYTRQKKKTTTKLAPTQGFLQLDDIGVGMTLT